MGGQQPMTKDEAIKACAKAIARRHGYRDETWKENSHAKDLAEDLVAALEALDLFKAK
jgi:hypothetical protein